MGIKIKSERRSFSEIKTGKGSSICKNLWLQIVGILQNYRPRFYVLRLDIWQTTLHDTIKYWANLEKSVHKLHWLRWILDACDIQTLKKVKVSLLQIFWKCAAVTEFKICLLVCRVWLTLAAQTEVGFFQASIHSFMPNETAFASGLSFASFPGSPLHPSFFLDAQSSVKSAAQVTGQWALHLWTSNCHYILIQ